MPLHLLGKKSWNVYNADNIARVRADEADAAAREAADEQRMQELDAERRAALLRGRTPPPLPEEDATKDTGQRRERDADARGHGRKRRKLAGEDDTAMEIRLAASASTPRDGANANVLKLRNTTSDAPLTDHAGNIDLFPVDEKEAIKREKNAEAEKEKKSKQRALEDQYTMRFSNAAGYKTGLSQPWYAASQKPSHEAGDGKGLVAYDGFENKNVWGNEDPRRKEREVARITSNDPFAFMQKAQAQLKRSKEDKKRWAEERGRELRELRAAQEREDRRSRHHKRKKRDEHDVENHKLGVIRRGVDKHRPPKHKNCRTSRSRSRSRERHTNSVEIEEGKVVINADNSRQARRDRKSERPRSLNLKDQHRESTSALIQQRG